MDKILPKQVQDTLHTLEKQILALESADALRNIRQSLFDIGANIEALIVELESKLNAKGLPRLFTVKDVADFFSTTTVTVYKWIDDGLLETVPSGDNKLRITEEAINKYIDTNKKMRSDPVFRKRIKDRIEATKNLKKKK